MWHKWWASLRANSSESTHFHPKKINKCVYNSAIVGRTIHFHTDTGTHTHNNKAEKFVRQINILITFEFVFSDVRIRKSCEMNDITFFRIQTAVERLFMTLSVQCMAHSIWNLIGSDFSFLFVFFSLSF